MAGPKVLTITVHLGQLDPTRKDQEVARHLRALASLVDSAGTYPDSLKDREGNKVLEVKLT